MLEFEDRVIPVGNPFGKKDGERREPAAFADGTVGGEEKFNIYTYERPGKHLRCGNDAGFSGSPTGLSSGGAEEMSPPHMCE